MATDKSIQLTPRERQVDSLRKDGMSLSGIARTLGVKEVTVEVYETSIAKKRAVLKARGIAERDTLDVGRAVYILDTYGRINCVAFKPEEHQPLFNQGRIWLTHDGALNALTHRKQPPKEPLQMAPAATPPQPTAFIHEARPAAPPGLPKSFMTISVDAIPEGCYLVSTDQGPVIRFHQGGRWYFPTNNLTIDLKQEASSNPLICILKKVS